MFKNATAGEPGFSVPSAVTVPRDVRVTARSSVTALKPWTRNGNMRPRVTATWSRMAPIIPRTA